jgi:LacI family transcriptional regulator
VGKSEPGLRDVAELAGVHISTASRALSGGPSASMVNPVTRRRVRESAEQLGYRVNGVARALKTRRSFTIGLLIPDITNPVFPPMVRGAEDVLDASGYSLVLGNTDDDEDKGRKEVSAMLQGQVAGLMLATARREDALVDELREGRAPVVLVNRAVDRAGVSAVVPDDEVGMALAVEHLERLGHRRIAYVSGPRTTSTGARRHAGFERAMRTHGLADAALVEVPAFTEAAGRGGAEEVLAGAARPTAIVAGNDTIALGVLDALRAQGLSCPDDMSLVGFNDMLFVDRIDPPLTTVRISQYDLGHRAAELLLARLADPDRRPETVLVSAELVVRGSTAAPAPRA